MLHSSAAAPLRVLMRLALTFSRPCSAFRPPVAPLSSFRTCALPLGRSVERLPFEFSRGYARGSSRSITSEDDDEFDEDDYIDEDYEGEEMDDDDDFSDETGEDGGDYSEEEKKPTRR